MFILEVGYFKRMYLNIHNEHSGQNNSSTWRNPRFGMRQLIQNFTQNTLTHKTFQ